MNCSLSVPLKNDVKTYRGADKSLARTGRKQATATKILSFIYPIYNRNWRNIITVYIYILYIYIYIYMYI
jgi:hypothetical protein